LNIGAIISENKKRIQLGNIIGGKALTKYCRIAHGGIAFNVNAQALAARPLCITVSSLSSRLGLTQNYIT
jgi:hypothetical protein